MKQEDESYSRSSDSTILTLFERVLEIAEAFDSCTLENLSTLTSQLSQANAPSESLPSQALSGEQLSGESLPGPALQAAVLQTVQRWQNYQTQSQELKQLLRVLQQQMIQMNLLYSINDLYGTRVSKDRVIETALDAIWQKNPLRFAVVVLGESELGPYSYQKLRGVPEAWQYLNQKCPFPLWGVLARALLPRLDPNEADYLVINNVATAKRPLPEEFPWMPLDGSLMILPLRAEEQVAGAILLGHSAVNAFAAQRLCADYHLIAHRTARVLQLAQMHQELNERSNQLLSLQLFTKSIANAHDYDKLVDVIIEGIFEALGRVDVSIILNEQLWHKGVNGNEVILPHVRRIIDWAMQAGQPIFYDPEDTSGSLEGFYYNESGYALIVPLLRNERTLGVIQILSHNNSRRFEDGDLIVLRTIANCTAVILENMSA